MFCENCGAEIHGNFCSNCGAPAPGHKDIRKKFPHDADRHDTETSSDTSMDAAYKAVGQTGRKTSESGDDQESGRERSKKKHSGSNVLKNGGRAVTKTASTAGKVTGKGIKTIWSLLFMGIHMFCAILMAGITYFLCRNVINHINDFGSVTDIISNRDPDQLVFFGGSALLIFFALLQIFWILSSGKTIDMGKVKHIDTGRGLFAFCIFLILCIATPIVIDRIPDFHSGVTGGIYVLRSFTDFGKNMQLCAGLGAVLSFVRKMR